MAQFDVQETSTDENYRIRGKQGVRARFCLRVPLRHSYVFILFNIIYIIRIKQGLGLGHLDHVMSSANAILGN
jgi:hypothetical protein